MFSPGEARFGGSHQQPQVASHLLEDDGVYPNNAHLPLLVYVAALDLPERNPAAVIESLFRQNRWGASWRNGVYGFHHYHSTAHEVLGVYGGSARVQFGGEHGIVLSVTRGDVVIIPAGVAHKNLGASPDFRVVGSYPQGQSWDMNYGQPGERPRADENIARVPLPAMDPLYAEAGPLLSLWQ
ncbi:MAG TPA: cupin domain-containing protein [Anaerolineae bacterium]|nr:cupin domain-containing protein [Anaerolineae bacterium]